MNAMRHLKFLLTFREEKEMLVKQQRTFDDQQGVADPSVGIQLVRILSFTGVVVFSCIFSA